MQSNSIGNNIVTQLTAKNVNLVNCHLWDLERGTRQHLSDRHRPSFMIEYGISSAGGKLNVSSSMYPQA